MRADAQREAEEKLSNSKLGKLGKKMSSQEGGKKLLSSLKGARMALKKVLMTLMGDASMAGDSLECSIPEDGSVKGEEAGSLGDAKSQLLMPLLRPSRSCCYCGRRDNSGRGTRDGGRKNGASEGSCDSRAPRSPRK